MIYIIFNIVMSKIIPKCSRREKIRERIIVNKPIDCASRKIGMYWIDSDKGKEALTEFERISFNGKTSVVKCFPKTGRTHQIRIHLQYLGFPIVNDPLYNHPIIWGPSNGKNGVYEFTKEEIEKNFLKIHTYEAWIIKQEVAEDGIDEKDSIEKFDLEDVGTKRKDSQDELTECKKQKLETNLEQEEIDKPAVDDEKSEIDPNLPGFDVSKLTKEDDCFECKQIYRDPVRSDMTMYLHALSYKFDDLEFKTEYPKWAAEDFNG
ncbi:RNA pseudouridylate synthase domain-containing 2-like isoform X2 [Brachionus plicatilis]|uniref:RNA pseudouridylate synthase domain-containing 2-like isoform X2 n=1 Tax=Brachionus plicatilis TaxID=10195 RepID=A0A3M7Q4W2_BRAPC|nr:RNA pseudouridylate synthase domain-containing 2-like isoform X2 [Brachionus plicatilis]